MVIQLYKTALSVAEMTIVKRDFDLLRKISLNLSPDIQMQMIPYTALFCYEVIEFINKHSGGIVIEQTSTYSIKDIRQKAKFFDLSINKLLQSIENIDVLQNDYFISLMRFPKFGRWNLHTNLGISFDDEKNIVGNTHYVFYLFQDQKMISQPKESMRGVKIDKKEINAFAYDMGRIIGSISSGLSSISDFMVSDIITPIAPFYSQDFNTNKCLTLGNEKYKLIRLFLLHVLSSIGFILFCLKKIIIRDTGFLLRLEYITYHYSLIRLDGILNYCKSHNGEIDDANLTNALERIDYSNANHLRKPEFRNCMMHFELKDKTGAALIQECALDLSLPFCGLVESQFDMTYSEYKDKIEIALFEIYTAIKNYLGFELLLSGSE